MERKCRSCFYNFEKDAIIKKIQDLGFTKKSVLNIRIIVLCHPSEYKRGAYICIKDKGSRVTIKWEEMSKTIAPPILNKRKIVTDNSDKAFGMLCALGCRYQHSYTKIREIWTLNDDEVIFDSCYQCPDIIKTKSKDWKTLDALDEQLGLSNHISRSLVREIQGKIYCEYKGYFLDEKLNLSNLSLVRKQG